MQNTDLFGEVSIRKFEKELTINFFFTWPDETNQAHDGDLMVRSAVCQNWLMCPFRGWQATWSPKSQTNFSQNPLTNQTQRDSFSQLSFVLSLKHNDFFFFFLFSPSALNWTAHSDLKMLFTIESYTYLSKCQMCSQMAKSDFSVET